MDTGCRLRGGSDAAAPGTGVPPIPYPSVELDLCHAAVDTELCSCDEAALVGGEEKDGRCKFFRSSHPSEWNHGREGGSEFVGRGLRNPPGYR